MGLSYRRRVRLGKNSWLNVSKSGVSVSRKVGGVTVNSRGRTSVRLAKGLTYRSSKNGCAVVLFVPVVMAGLLAGGWLTLR